MKSFGNILWYTNIDIKKRHEPLPLFRRYSDDPSKYPHYDNYDAINVDKVADIPEDYEGVMGVPITFLNRHCPEQFEILGLLQSSTEEQAGISILREYNDFSGILLTSPEPRNDICGVLVEDSGFDCAIMLNTLTISPPIHTGDEVFVLGFPFLMNNGSLHPEPVFIKGAIYPQALLKHGYVSGCPSDDNRRQLLIDMHNNAGFSGSPILKRVYSQNSCDGLILMGVLCGFYWDEINGKIEKQFNSGIAYGCPFSLLQHRILKLKEEI